MECPLACRYIKIPFASLEFTSDAHSNQDQYPFWHHVSRYAKIVLLPIPHIEESLLTKDDRDQWPYVATVGHSLNLFKHG